MADMYEDHHHQLCNGVRKHRTSYTDITLVVGEVRIAAHKIILCSFSTYFEALFRSPFEMDKQDEIIMKDLNGSIVADIVEYAYTGELEFTPETVQDVLLTANFLGIRVVECACIEFIDLMLSLDICIDVYNMGLALGDSGKRLCLKVIKFMRTCFTLFAQSPRFVDVPGEALRSVLKSDRIQFRDPEEVPIPANQEHCILKAVMKYVYHDEDHRLSELPKLLRNVYMNVLLPSVLETLKVDNMVKRSPEALQIVIGATIGSPISVEDCDSEKKCGVQHYLQLGKSRKNKMLKESWSALYATEPLSSHRPLTVSKFNDADYVPITAHVKAMKIFTRKLPPEGVLTSLFGYEDEDTNSVWAGYEIRFSNGYVAHHGGRDFGEEEYKFELDEDEVITSLEINADRFINCITFITNKQRRLGPYGPPGSTTTIVRHGGAGEMDGYLVGTKGIVVKSGDQEPPLQGVRELSFLWAYARERTIVHDISAAMDGGLKLENGPHGQWMACGEYSCYTYGPRGSPFSLSHDSSTDDEDYDSNYFDQEFIN